MLFEEFISQPEAFELTALAQTKPAYADAYSEPVKPAETVEPLSFISPISHPSANAAIIAAEPSADKASTEEFVTVTFLISVFFAFAATTAESSGAFEVIPSRIRFVIFAESV